MAELRQGVFRGSQTMDEIVFDGERDVVDATAAVVVIERAFVVVMMVTGRV